MRRLLAHPASGNDDDYDVLAAIDRKRSWAELKSRSAARLPRAILLIQSTGAAGIEAPRVPVRSSFGESRPCFIFAIRTVVLAVAACASSLSSAAPLSEQSELLCSPEGLMRLIPQFNANGQFHCRAWKDVAFWCPPCHVNSGWSCRPSGG